jgi:hypothetical protein
MIWCYIGTIGRRNGIKKIFEMLPKYYEKFPLQVKNNETYAYLLSLSILLLPFSIVILLSFVFLIFFPQLNKFYQKLDLFLDTSRALCNGSYSQPKR